jgi:hypothetical protein
MKVFRVIPCRLFLLFVIAAYSVLASSQATAPSTETPSLRDFFASMLRTSSVLPTWQEFDRIERPIPLMSPDDLRSALPLVIEVLHSSNPTARRYSAAALLAISTRRDSADLLNGYIPEILALLNAQEDYMQRGALLILAMLKPAHPPQLFPPLYQFLKRTDRDPEIQVGALGLLLSLKPEDSQVVQAVEEFTSRALPSDIRVAALNAIRNSTAKDARIATVVISSLDDPHPGVELAAIAALDRMGPEAQTKAQPALARLSKGDSADVSAAARKALSRIGPQPH